MPLKMSGFVVMK